MTIPEHWGQHSRDDLLTIKIVNDEAFYEYEGFDIANFQDNPGDASSKVLTFYVPMGESYASFKLAVVKHLGLESQVRFWVLTDRMNESVRVEEAIDEDSQVNSMSISRVWRWLAPNSKLFRLYLEVPSDPNRTDISSGSDATSALIFLKYFDIPKQKLYGVGKMRVSNSKKLSEMFNRINELMGWQPHRKLRLCEEVQPGLIGNLNAARSFSENDIQTGDIVCFQELFTATEREILTIRHPGLVVDIAQFCAELHNPSLRRAEAAIFPRLLPPSFDFTVSPEESFGDALKRVQERVGVLNKELTNYRFICARKDNHINSLTSFDSLINCAICMEIFTDPVAFIDCMHLACGACAVEWFKYSSTCHQCRQPVKSIRDNHATAAIVEAYRQSSAFDGRTDAELASLRTIYKPGQVIDIDQSDAETQPDYDWDDTPVEPERPYSEHGCPCCNPDNQLDFLCPEPILDDDTCMVFPGHSRCADCSGHLPLIPEFNSTCCAVCARFTCHELGLQCDASEDLPVPFSLQALKDVRFSKKLDTNLLKFIPIEHEREVLMKYARENDIGSQALFEKVLEHHSRRGLPRASWHAYGVRQAPFDPYFVRVDDMICFSCARNLLAANIFGWWRSLYTTLTPTAAFSRSNWCPYGISCLRALSDELHAQTSHHICSPTAGNHPNVIRSSTGASEGGERMEYHTTTNLHDIPFPFSLREVLFRERGGDPVFLCSVVLEAEGGRTSTVPGKLVLRRRTALAFYSLDGDELRHDGTIRVLVDTRNMRWVRTSKGRLPPGCRPVLGGLDMRDETDVLELFHCAAWYNGQRIPGYIARGREYASISFEGETYKISENYDLLCWA